MLSRLANTCAGLWFFGLVGMTLFHGFFDLGPTTHSFQICASLWLVGGIGYAALGLSCLKRDDEAVPERVSEATRLSRR